MKKVYLSIFTSLLLLSCNDFEAKEANHLLDEARMATENNHFDSARNLIDSIRTLYPRQFDVRRAALAFSDTIELEQAKFDLSVADSVFTFKELELQDLKSQFVLEKQPKYQTTGFYVTPDYAGSKSNCDFFTEVEETGALLCVSINRSGNINYDFKEVEIDLTNNVVPSAPVSRSLSSKEQAAYEKCYMLARCFKEYETAKAAKEKYDVKVRFFERKIKEQTK